MTDRRLGAAIIGCGNMGRTHARLLASFEDVALRVLVDANPEAAEALNAEVGPALVSTDYERALQDDAVDVVLICTHHHLHAPMCVAAAEAGKDIFCEKPLAIRMDDCEAIANAVNAAGVKFVTGFQARFSPFVVRLKEVAPSPWLTIAQLFDPRWGEQSWANDPVEGGGNVLSQGCHCFDAVRFLNAAEVDSIYAAGGNYHHPTLPITDAVACTLKFADGAVANVAIGDVGKPALMGKAAYQIFAGDTTACLYNYYWEPEIRIWGAAPERLTAVELPGCENSDFAHGYVQQMRALVDWSLRGIEAENAATVEDGVRATALGVRAIDAIRTGEVQELNWGQARPE
ncbi:MAG: Gfo/Idh/MocA family oxidoreductase [Gemmatimonadota bacterium]|nr:Gfo/Idh/MocA family oxidoreductase [Gemmatimonadota bacterium]